MTVRWKKAPRDLIRAPNTKDLNWPLILYNNVIRFRFHSGAPLFSLCVNVETTRAHAPSHPMGAPHPPGPCVISVPAVEPGSCANVSGSNYGFPQYKMLYFLPAVVVKRATRLLHPSFLFLLLHRCLYRVSQLTVIPIKCFCKMLAITFCQQFLSNQMIS